SKKLSTLIESESLLNDGTAIVMFMVLIGIATGETEGGVSASLIEFLRVALGGTLVGLIIGWLINYWLKQVFNDPLFEITVIVAAAYLTFFVAEHFFHVSGVLGLVSLGLLMSSVGRTRISPEVHHFLHDFWELAAFIANTLIFIMVGVVVTLRTQFSFSDLWMLMVVYVGIHVARAAMIALFYPIMKKSGYGMNKNDAIVLWWGGLRGAVGLALALIVATNSKVPENVGNQILFFTAGIVLLTSFINATTTKAVVSLLGMTKISSSKAALLISNSKLLRQSSENTLEKLKNDRYMKGADWEIVKNHLPNELVFSETEIIQVDAIAEMRKKILQKEKASYWEQFEEGLLGRDAVIELSGAVTVLMDEDGKVPLSARKDMEYLWKSPKILSQLQKVPIIKIAVKKIFFNRLANSYDCARGFVAAQEDVLKLLKSLALNIDESSTKLTLADFEMLENEIYENRIQGLTFIRNLKDAFPEIYQAIETRQAIRTLLNHQRAMVHKFVEQRKMEPDEAIRFKQTIEEQMHHILNNPPEPGTKISNKIINEIPWLNNLTEEQKKKFSENLVQEVYSVGEIILKSRRNNNDILIIQRGTAKMIVDNITADILGPGSIIGETSIIGNVCADAVIESELPVTLFRISGSSLQKLMHEIPLLNYNLWTVAAQRLAEELLQFHPSYKEFSQSELRTILSRGELIHAISGQKFQRKNRTTILLQGSIVDTETSKEMKTIGIVEFQEFICDNNTKLFIL
ncbi:MAG TPA: cation:proton antiporter, partial [Salinivirgaceae bacterium]|nr:cation:proton antiporter [Salinivirgaceae bacterium]